MGEEVIVPFHPSRERVPSLVSVRSTLIGSSMLALRARGLEGRYLATLPREYADAVLHTPAGVWLPSRVALEHYLACDRLELDSATIVDIGRQVTVVTQKSALAMILRLAKQAGANPWTLFSKCDQLWARIFDGSGIAIFKLGPKEARFEVAGCSLVKSAYWRTGLRSLLSTANDSFVTKMYIREIPGSLTSSSCVFRISWV